MSKHGLSDGTMFKVPTFRTEFDPLLTCAQHVTVAETPDVLEFKYYQAAPSDKAQDAGRSKRGSASGILLKTADALKSVTLANVLDAYNYGIGRYTTIQAAKDGSGLRESMKTVIKELAVAQAAGDVVGGSLCNCGGRGESTKATNINAHQ